MRLLKQLLAVFAVLGILGAALMLFTYDVIKIDWVGFMEIQPSFRAMEHPLPPPVRSIPIEGPAAIIALGPPENPVEGDAISVARGAELFAIHCQLCHGVAGEGNGPVSAFLLNKKPADLTSGAIQDKSDGDLFLTVSYGKPDTMPPLNENLTVRERWDVINFVRTLAASQ